MKSQLRKLLVGSLFVIVMINSAIASDASPTVLSCKLKLNDVEKHDITLYVSIPESTDRPVRLTTADAQGFHYEVWAWPNTEMKTMFLQLILSDGSGYRSFAQGVFEKGVNAPGTLATILEDVNGKLNSFECQFPGKK
jgi:hypothetical protein